MTPGARRAFMTTSACGVCGKTSIERHLRAAAGAAVRGRDACSTPAVIASLPDRLREAQRVFSSTGGLHAAGLFTAAGELLAVREDVGQAQRGRQDRRLGAAATTSCR